MSQRTDTAAILWRDPSNLTENRIRALCFWLSQIKKHDHPDLKRCVDIALSDLIAHLNRTAGEARKNWWEEEALYIERIRRRIATMFDGHYPAPEAVAGITWLIGTEPPDLAYLGTEDAFRYWWPSYLDYVQPPREPRSQASVHRVPRKRRVLIR